MTATTKRKWTGTAGFPVASPAQCSCDDPERCGCEYVVELPLFTADGRSVVATLTVEAALTLAAQIESAAQIARALS